MGGWDGAGVGNVRLKAIGVIGRLGNHFEGAPIALASAAALMLASPFPLPIRVLLPFTYFFAFQYAVIARSYVLFPAILLALACVAGQTEAPFCFGIVPG